MSIGAKLLKELKSLSLTALYFLAWFGALMVLKVLMLHEYKLEFYGMTMVIVGALVAAKAVLILENVPLSGKKPSPAIVEILLRTILYMAGVFVILVLEKSIEARHEYGGFFPALKGLAGSADRYHIWVNIICMFGAIFFFNLGSVTKAYLGETSIWKMLRAPVPEKKKHIKN